ncbi:MAG: aminoacyl-histidine dipeptidase [Bacteroidaceae bacterium]|nr:aminoacyl-histidine dipeptidase [Bacteroidaceae bacterium]
MENLNPKCVFKNFKALTQIPRPSGHLEKVQQFLLDFGKKCGVETFVDPAGNIVMRKPATPGMENRQGVILQAHMDMVPQKESSSNHNFETDPIEARICDDGWIRANKTTLGSDDGIGVAAIMAVMEATDLKHGPVEGLMTVDEETGLYGANNLPAGQMQGNILLNLDTEDWGELIIGSAGGMDVNATLDYKEEDVETTSAELTAAKITLKGLLGGHSGIQIPLGRGNANKMMVRILREAISDDDARLVSWHGGNMRNAIPREATVVVTLPKDNMADLKDLCNTYAETFNEEYKYIETEEIKVIVEEVELPQTQTPKDIQDNIVDAIYAAHDGVWRYIPSIPDKVETSSNLSIVDIEGGKASIALLARSSSDTKKDELCTSLESCFSMAGMKVEQTGGYGGWNPNPESPVLKAMVEQYKVLFNEDPLVSVVHAGLECSIIMGKYPGMDVVSFGPTLQYPHTPSEQLKIDTVEPFWKLIVATLENAPEK